MNLYHFTSLANVEAIKRLGLLPSLTGDSLSMVGYGPPVVFLCEKATTALTDRELEIFRAREPNQLIVCKRWLKSHTSEPLARFTVRIPSSDRKLKRYRQWLRRHLFAGCPDPDDSFLVRHIDSWWIYFGEIPASMIMDCVIEPASFVETSSRRMKAVE